MTPRNGNTPFVIRTAVWIGDAFGRWQKKRAAAKDDVFVERWKAAWNEGCEAYGAGKSSNDVPYPRSPGKDAWIAGWRWAEQRRAEKVASSPVRRESAPAEGVGRRRAGGATGQRADYSAE
jgi:ribosome modulation factor